MWCKSSGVAAEGSSGKKRPIVKKYPAHEAFSMFTKKRLSFDKSVCGKYRKTPYNTCYQVNTVPDTAIR